MFSKQPPQQEGGQLLNEGVGFHPIFRVLEQWDAFLEVFRKSSSESGSFLRV
jgi:hypothetical protein